MSQLTKGDSIPPDRPSSLGRLREKETAMINAKQKLRRIKTLMDAVENNAIKFLQQLPAYYHVKIAGELEPCVVSFRRWALETKTLGLSDKGWVKTVAHAMESVLHPLHDAIVAVAWIITTMDKTSVFRSSLYQECDASVQLAKVEQSIQLLDGLLDRWLEMLAPFQHMEERLRELKKVTDNMSWAWIEQHERADVSDRTKVVERMWNQLMAHIDLDDDSFVKGMWEVHALLAWKPYGAKLIQMEEGRAECSVMLRTARQA